MCSGFLCESQGSKRKDSCFRQRRSYSWSHFRKFVRDSQYYQISPHQHEVFASNANVKYETSPWELHSVSLCSNLQNRETGSGVYESTLTFTYLFPSVVAILMKMWNIIIFYKHCSIDMCANRHRSARRDPWSPNRAACMRIREDGSISLQSDLHAAVWREQYDNLFWGAAHRVCRVGIIILHLLLSLYYQIIRKVYSQHLNTKTEKIHYIILSANITESIWKRETGPWR